MELTTLHLYDPAIAERYVNALQGNHEPDWPWWNPDLPQLLKKADEIAAMQVSTGLVMAMADAHPAWHQEGCSLTAWEAQFDRGVGMLMRPPARVFVDNGVHPLLVATMPIRLDLQGGIMGGAWVPPHLIAKLDELVDTRLELWAKRIHEADMDPYPLLATMRMAVDGAKKSGLGLIEAINVLQPGARVVETPDRKRMDAGLRARIDAALEPEKKPGLFGRLFGRQE